MSFPDPRPDPPDTSPPCGVVDETLLDSLLALSPEERLRLNDRMALTIQELRHGFAAAEVDQLHRWEDRPLETIPPQVIACVSRDGLGAGERLVLAWLEEHHRDPRAR
jgi:hypothetical protein